MTFQPLIPVGGLPGWVVLNATLERQTAAFNETPLIQRDTEYFEQNIGQVQTAAQLVEDRRLLRVALGAFGLQEDINNRAFIQKILEQGTQDDDALANRLTDERYKQLSDAFGFRDNPVPRTQLATFGAEITDAFRQREFEVAVGEQDEALRLALNARRELPDIVTSDESEDALWFQIMGTPPLRKIFETSLGLPASFGQQDIDRQLETFKSLSSRRLGIGSLVELADGDRLEKLIERFLLQDQISSFEIQSSNAIALTLLQAVPNRF